MAIKKSIVLTALLGEAAEDISIFRAGAEKFAGKGITTIEFFAPFDKAAEYGAVLRELQCDGIFLAAAHQKKNRFWLSDLDPEKRSRAVAETMWCADAARKAGCRGLLITSGALPENGNRQAAMRALEQSLESILQKMPPEMELLLEPGDVDVDACQLIGHTEEAAALIARMWEKFSNISLTMDTSHTAQLGEDVKAALQTAAPWCRHIHLANCILQKGHPLYGDKHPWFNDPDGVFTAEKLQGTMEFAASLYAGKELTLSVEIIGRAGYERDLDAILQEEQWYFQAENL